MTKMSNKLGSEFWKSILEITKLSIEENSSVGKLVIFKL